MDYMCYQCPTGSCTCSSPNDFLDLVNKPSTGDGFNGFITECKQCPENRASLDQAGLTATSCHCDATSFESSGECTDCPDSESGSLALPYPNLADELSDCWCPAGKTLGSLTTGGSCDPCPYGKICPSPRVKFDKGKREFDCPSDSTMLSGSVSQTTARACAPDTKEGTYLLLNATDPDLSEVRNCPAMTNQNMRYRSHDDNPDFFATTAAVTSAPVGVQTTGVCRTECAEGFILGANGCECEAPKLSVPGKEGCFCPQGQYEDVATGTCVQCPENFFCPSPEVKASLGSSKIACPSSDNGLVDSFSVAGSPSASYCMPGSPGYYVWKQRPQKLYHCPDLTDPTTAFSDFNTQQNNPVSGDYVWDNENALTPADVSYDQLNQYPSASNDRLCAIECGDGYEPHQGQQLGSGNFLCQCSDNTRIKGDDDAQCECKARFFGTDLQATAGQCQQCPANKYCTGGSHQADCEEDTFSGRGQAGSAEECGCAPGYYNENADTPGALRSCKQCAKGTLCPGGQRFETCEAGVYCPLIGGEPGQTGAKVACPPGSTSPAGSTQEEDCQPCSAGTFCEGGAALRNCTNDDSQKAFVTSKTSATSISDCECKPGYYGAVTAQAATCQQCPVGSFCPGGASFTLCANGTTGDTQGATSQEECRACPANYKCVNGGQEACFKDGVVAEKDLDTAAGAGTACFCKAGFYGAPPDVACEPCASPFFCPAGNNLLAKACPTDKVTAMAQATFASDCQCKPGKYPVGDGCADCWANHWCSGPDLPAPCPTGTGSPLGANARTELECRCPAGQYADPSSTSSLQCLQCKPGFFCRDGGITACPTGKTSEQGSDSADDCACRAGYTVFGSECLSCPPGQFCVQGVSAGTKCPANTYSMLPRNAPNSLSCAQCPAESAGSPAGSAGIESCGVSRVAVKEQSATVLGLPYEPASGEDISLPAVLGTFSVSVSSGVTAQAAATALRDAAKAVLGGTGSYLPGPGVGRVGAPMFAQVYVTERTVARRRALLQDSAVDLSMDIRVRLSSGFVDGTKEITLAQSTDQISPDDRERASKLAAASRVLATLRDNADALASLMGSDYLTVSGGDSLKTQSLLADSTPVAVTLARAAETDVKDVVGTASLHLNTPNKIVESQNKIAQALQVDRSDVRLLSAVGDVLAGNPVFQYQTAPSTISTDQATALQSQLAISPPTSCPTGTALVRNIVCGQCEQGKFAKNSVCLDCSSPPASCPEGKEPAPCSSSEDARCVASQGGSGSTACGDGLLRVGVEECDDGNKVAGDGCSGTCRIEAGWECPQPSAVMLIDFAGSDIAIAGSCRPRGTSAALPRSRASAALVLVALAGAPWAWMF